MPLAYARYTRFSIEVGPSISELFLNYKGKPEAYEYKDEGFDEGLRILVNEMFDLQ
jgi:hypothetical protein